MRIEPRINLKSYFIPHPPPQHLIFPHDQSAGTTPACKMALPTENLQMEKSYQKMEGLQARGKRMGFADLCTCWLEGNFSSPPFFLVLAVAEVFLISESFQLWILNWFNAIVFFNIYGKNAMFQFIRWYFVTFCFVWVPLTKIYSNFQSHGALIFRRRQQLPPIKPSTAFYLSQSAILKEWLLCQPRVSPTCHKAYSHHQQCRQRGLRCPTSQHCISTQGHLPGGGKISTDAPREGW